MDIDAMIQELEEITGLEVVPDLYHGEEDKFIVYSIQGEQQGDGADDSPQYDEIEVAVSLYTRPDFYYRDYKKQIWDYLESIGESVSCTSYLDTYSMGNNEMAQIRHTVITATITQWR